MKIRNNIQILDVKQIKSVNTYAKIINKTTQAVRNHIRDGKVDSVKIDGKIFVIL